MAKEEIILEYLKKVKSANKELTKKEAFKDMLNRLYADSSEMLELVNQISMGAEKAIFNIQLEDRSKRGSADTYFNKVIIEFENNLKTSEKHAVEQLAEYLSGSYNSGEGYNFLLVVSDFINWKIYAPTLESFDGEKLNVSEIELEEKTDESFVLTEKNCEEFYYYIDRILFKENDQRATLERIKQDFGVGSQTFIESIRVFKQHFNDAKKYGEVKVAFDQWKRFLSIAYGTFDSSEDKYLVHTYLSIFSKMLAYSVLKGDKIIEDDDIERIVNGKIFDQLNVRNFIDHDFYYWVSIKENFPKLKKAFRRIAQQVSTYDFAQVDEDILKGVYQDLIDLDTRHALGEYYTPDWLCEAVVSEYTFKQTDKILDPACGSGSFLRAVADKLIKENPDQSIREINDQIYGIDIHPLSVQIAKTTLLIAFGNKVLKADKPVYLHVYLSNSVLLPEDETLGGKSLELFGKTFKLSIDNKKYKLNEEILLKPDLFDVAINIADELAESTQHKKLEDPAVFSKVIERKIGGKLNAKSLADFYEIYKAFKAAKEANRNGIWRYVVQNYYRPFFHKKKFDYVIGNPPWFTYSDIRNAEYQESLSELAQRYRVLPKSRANMPHLEIAAIFLAHSTTYFLKEGGKVAFVLPRSFFSADHHDETRSGKAASLKITALWDMDEVSPLFRVPTCVIFGESGFGIFKPSADGIPGKIWSGRPKAHNANWAAVKDKVSNRKTKFYYSALGKSSAFTPFKMKKNAGVSHYHRLFKQGATIVPRNFYFVQPESPLPSKLDGKEISIRTSEASKKEAKAPWKDIDFKGLIEGELLFCTALSKNILPFVLHGTELITLPAKTERNIIQLLTWEELKADGFIKGSDWFRNVENVWDLKKTENNKGMSANNYLNWQNKLTDQPLDTPFLVLYNSSAKDANTVLVRRSELNLTFIVESKTYWVAVKNEDEAYYLIASLNSQTPNELMKHFQTRGLFGARDVHKRILDVPFPKFDPKNDDHLKLSRLGKVCETKAKEWIASENLEAVTGLDLGKARLEIKKHLIEEMREIDDIVKELIL